MGLPKSLKYAAIGLGTALFGVIFGWVLFPAILKHQLKKEMALSKKTDVRMMWEKIPFALDFKVYMFNYTNVDEIVKGGTPIVKEIGPFYFEEWKEKVEIEDHEEDDTITYKTRDTFLFRPDLSAPGLTGEEVVTIPHLFMLGAAISVNRDKPAMLNMVGKALNGIFDNPPDIFLRVKVLDILFRGVIINCARTEFAPKAACTQFKKEAIKGLVLEPNNQFRFSLFGTRNHTISPTVVTVKRGIQNVMDVGSVVALDGEPKMSIWRDHCNEYQGTDGTVFPPFLTAEDRLQSFSGDLCSYYAIIYVTCPRYPLDAIPVNDFVGTTKSFKPRYQKKTSYSGIRTNRYIANIGDFVNDPELQCFCPTPNSCPPKGLMDMAPCLKAPMYVSMPHFLDSDPELLNNVKGLNPDVEEHEIQIDFEPISGTPMVAKQRVQFNIELLKTEKLEWCKELPGKIVPVFWIEEGLALNKTFVKMLKNQLFIPKRIVGVLKWWLLSFGLLWFLVAILHYFKDNIMKLATSGDDNKVNNITPEAEGQKDISVIGEGQEPAKVTM